MQAMLSILKMMCWCANFSSISRNGSKIPICSKVEVLFPNQDPLLSFFSMINSFSRQSWKAKQVSDGFVQTYHSVFDVSSPIFIFWPDVLARD
jgi:hypothetical protein